MKNINNFITEKLILSQKKKTIKPNSDYKNLTPYDITEEILFDDDTFNEEFLKAVMPLTVLIGDTEQVLDGYVLNENEPNDKSYLMLLDDELETSYIGLSKDDVVPFFKGKKSEFYSREKIHQMNMYLHTCELLTFYGD